MNKEHLQKALDANKVQLKHIETEIKAVEYRKSELMKFRGKIYTDISKSGFIIVDGIVIEEKR